MEKKEGNIFVLDDNYNFEKLLKSNSIIFGKTAVDSPTGFYAKDLKVLNFLLKMLQEAIRQDKKLPTTEVAIDFPLETYKIIMDNQSSWKKVLMNSVKRLSKIFFDLKNYYDPETKEFVEYQSTSLIYSPKFYSSKENKIKDRLRIVFPMEIARSSWQKSNYTHISFRNINELKQKYSIKFYEILVSKIQKNINNNDDNDVITLDKKEIMSVFDSSFRDDISLYHLLINIASFESKVLPELKEILPVIDYKIYPKDYLLSFILDKEKLECFRTQKMSIYEYEIRKFRNLLSIKKDNESETTENNGIKKTTIDSYMFDEKGIGKGLGEFLELLCKNYSGKELLKTEKEKNEFGNILISLSGNFIDKDKGYSSLSMKRQEKFLKYYYKNYYSRVLSEVEGKEKLEKKEKEKTITNIIFKPFIHSWVKFNDELYGNILNVICNEDQTILVTYEIYKTPQKNNIVKIEKRQYGNMKKFSSFFFKHQYEN